jgi:CubicO group peptidase (beta-lactamase class C family)
LDSEKLDQLASALGGRGCVVRNGFVVKSWGSQSEHGDWLSSAKPVFSTLLLFAVQEGKLSGVDVRIEDLGWSLIRKDRTMTLRHLTNMVSGYARPESPDAAWAYNDYAIQLYQLTLFDRIFRGAPETVANAPHRLGALQLEDGLRFLRNRRLSASVRDFARIAWFWLHRGRWKTEQLLPERLFDENQRPQTPPDLPHTAEADTNDYLGIGTFGGGSDHFTEFGSGIYGFNWWFNGTGRLHPNRRTWPDAPRDTFMSIGAGGNCSVVVPSLNLVLVAAKADWGKLQAGDRSSRMNRHIGLLTDAVSG